MMLEHSLVLPEGLVFVGFVFGLIFVNILDLGSVILFFLFFVFHVIFGLVVSPDRIRSNGQASIGKEGFQA